jgi:hypothetical protein
MEAPAFADGEMEAAFTLSRRGALHARGAGAMAAYGTLTLVMTVHYNYTDVALLGAAPPRTLLFASGYMNVAMASLHCALSLFLRWRARAQAPLLDWIDWEAVFIAHVILIMLSFVIASPTYAIRLCGAGHSQSVWAPESLDKTPYSDLLISISLTVMVVGYFVPIRTRKTRLHIFAGLVIYVTVAATLETTMSWPDRVWSAWTLGLFCIFSYMGCRAYEVAARQYWETYRRELALARRVSELQLEVSTLSSICEDATAWDNRCLANLGLSQRELAWRGENSMENGNSRMLAAIDSSSLIGSIECI